MSTQPSNLPANDGTKPPAGEQATKPSSETTPTPDAKSPIDEWLELARRHGARVALYLASLVAAIVGLQQLHEHVEKLGSWKWAGYAVIAVLLLAAGIDAWSEFQRWRRERQLRRLRIEVTPGYFRTTPYEVTAHDRQQFRREDGKHEEVHRWVLEPPEPLLYLTGFSGTGKTSLLNAFVIPRLNESNPPIRVIVLRSFDDPVNRLRHELCCPGVVYDKPPPAAVKGDLSITDLLRMVSTYLRKESRRLVVIFDQFEELEFGTGRDPSRLASVRDFLHSITTGQFPGLTVLLSLREDNKGFLNELQLPAMVQKRNWLFVDAFTWAAARKFLQDGGSFGEEVLNRVLEEASVLEGTPGRIRPIILNMLGQLLEESKGLFPSGETGALVQNAVRRRLQVNLIRDDAPPILWHMLTESGRKYPRTVGDLHKETRINVNSVENCLTVLNSQGLVRRTDKPQEVTQRVWEIAHDFIAQLLFIILRTQRPSVWSRLRPALAPLALVLWAVMFFYVVFYVVPDYMRREPERAAELLQREYGFLCTPTQDGYDVEVRDKSITSLEPMSPHLKQLGRIRKLDIRWCEKLTNVDVLKGLTALQTLDLHNCRSLTNVDALQGLTSLQKLDLSYCGVLTNVDALRGLTALQDLNLDHCSNLTNVDGLKGLTALQKLDLGYCYSLTNVDGLRGLKGLQTLVLDHCRNLTNVDALKGLKALQFLHLSYCEELTNVDALKGLTALQDLNLHHCSNLTNVDVLQGLTTLQSLYLQGCVKLTNVDGLEGLPALQTLDLSGTKLTNVDARGLTALQTLYLRRCEKLTNVDARGLTALQSLDLSDTDLTDVDGLKGLTALQTLDLRGCTDLTGVDGLKGLTALQFLDLENCFSLKNVQGLRDLRALQFLNLIECDELKSVQELQTVSRLKVVGLPRNISDEEIEQLQAHFPKATIIKGDWDAYRKAVEIARKQ